MNKIFKTIWNKARQAYVAVSEISQFQYGHGFDAHSRINAPGNPKLMHQ